MLFLFVCSEGDRPMPNEKRKEKNAKRGGGSRFEPYASPSKRFRAFITNIPFDVKWQYLKDLVKEKGKMALGISELYLSSFPVTALYRKQECV